MVVTWDPCAMPTFDLNGACRTVPPPFVFWLTSCFTLVSPYPASQPPLTTLYKIDDEGDGDSKIPPAASLDCHFGGSSAASSGQRSDAQPSPPHPHPHPHGRMQRQQALPKIGRCSSLAAGGGSRGTSTASRFSSAHYIKDIYAWPSLFDETVSRCDCFLSQKEKEKEKEKEKKKSYTRVS